MSLLRLSRPGQPPVLIDQGPSTGRLSATRYGIRGGGPPIVAGSLAVGVSNRIGHDDGRRGRKFVDLKARSNPDDGGVQASTTEVQR